MIPAELHEVENKPEGQRREAKYPHIFESGNDGTLHVLYVAGLSAFIVWALAEACKSSEAQSLALIVFFVVSIAGGVLVGPEDRGARPEIKLQVTASPDVAETRGTAAACDPCDPQPTPLLETAMDTRCT